MHSHEILRVIRNSKEYIDSPHLRNLEQVLRACSIDDEPKVIANFMIDMVSLNTDTLKRLIHCQSVSASPTMVVPFNTKFIEE